MTTDPSSTSPRSALASLRRFLRPQPVRERCELCSAQLAEEHDHLVELATRRLRCTCEACAILFSNPEAPKFRRVPRCIQYLADFRLSDAQWEGLQLPINLAFFLPSTTAEQVVALYPSPAGATEALPPPDAWQALVKDNPVLRQLEPDVEGLLVNRLGPEMECYRLGIDQCYKLVGLVRTHWRGLSGGTEVWEAIRGFFTALRERAAAAREGSHA
jgi:hypothetical protein